MTKTPEQMAEEFADDWHKDCDYPEAILKHTKRATATVFLAGYKAAMKKYDIALIEEKIKRESKEVLMSLLQQRAKEIAEDK